MTIERVAIRFRSRGRSYERRLVAWCPDDHWHLPEGEIRHMCPGAGCPRKLVKRRMWICNVVECQQGYRNKKDAENHGWFSAY